MLGALTLSVLAGEGLSRIVDGRSILGEARYFGSPPDVPLDDHMARIEPTQTSVGQLWRTSPPPLENRREPSGEDLQRMREFGDRAIDTDSAAQVTRFELFKVWNSKVVAGACHHQVLKHLTRWPLDYFESRSGDDRPRYRYRPNATLPIGLGVVTNQIGWRGKPIAGRTPETVRIVFVGGSTIAEGPFVRWSAPELIEEWLNAWAGDQGLHVRFQVLNAGREGATTADVLAIVRDEVIGLWPDLVVFYEGALKFDWSSAVDNAKKLRALPRPQYEGVGWVAALARQSSLFAHILTALDDAGVSIAKIGEAAKPNYTIVWPEGLDEAEPDIRRKDLPVNLTSTLDDFDQIRRQLDQVGAEFALSSFAWLVSDGLMLDPIKGRFIWETNNRTYWPWTYRDIRRGVDFENRVYQKYATSYGLVFFDVARLIPPEPLLFADGVHMTQSGVRVKAWAFFHELLPVIEQHLESKEWPRITGADRLPTFEVKRRSVRCDE